LDYSIQSNHRTEIIDFFLLFDFVSLFTEQQKTSAKASIPGGMDAWESKIVEHQQCQWHCHLMHEQIMAWLPTGVGMPEPTISGGSKDAVQQQLEQLNKEAEVLAADLVTARNAWLSNRGDMAYKDVYDDIKAMRAQLDKMREGLLAKLQQGEQYAYYQVAVRFCNSGLVLRPIV
jgi:hypothetical protein